MEIGPAERARRKSPIILMSKRLVMVYLPPEDKAELVDSKTLFSKGNVKGGDRTDTPPCDDKVIGKEALQTYFPTGPPENLAQIIMKNSPYSYVVLSKLNAEVSEAGKDAECVSVYMPTSAIATLTKKYYDGPILKEKNKEYSVTQGEYYLEYKEKHDKQPYRLYPLFLKNNVLITYKCCEKCKGKTPNVGIAVPDGMINDSATKATIAEAKVKLQDWQLDGNVRNLRPCSDVEIVKQ